MMRSLTMLAAAAVASAQTWYGIAPDNTISGQINLFEMSAFGAPGAGAAVVLTSDQEYPKSGTLQCLWGSDVCYFLTGVGRPYVQDYVYGVNRTSGATIFKHTVPAGIYLDNLVLDWATDTLYSIAFDPRARTAALVGYNGATGEPNVLLDLTQEIRAGFVFPGSVSVCPSTMEIYVGVQVEVADGSFPDFFFSIDISTPATPKVKGFQQLAFPIPSAIRAFCNATSLVGVLGDYIQQNSFDRETLVLGNVVEPGREGFFFPFAKGDLPTFNARGQIPLFLNGMISEFRGVFLVPVFPPFQPGPGPAPALPGGLLWTWEYPGRPGPAPGRLTPIGYYLAGASGVPGR